MSGEKSFWVDIESIPLLPWPSISLVCLETYSLAHKGTRDKCGSCVCALCTLGTMDALGSG